MDVYYHVKFQLFITSGSKVSRGVQNCKHIPEQIVFNPPVNRVKILGNVLKKRPKKFKNEHLIPYKAGLNFFSKRNLAQTMLLIALYNQSKNQEDFQSHFGEKRKNLKNGHLIPYTLEFIFFFRRAIQLKRCKLGRSLEPTQRKGQKP